MALSSAYRLRAFKALREHSFEFIDPRLRTRRLLRVLVWTAATIAAVSAVGIELRSSWVQSLIFSAISNRMSFKLAPGASPAIRFSRTGPYDGRLGYSRIPNFVERTNHSGYRIEAQARSSKLALTMSDLGVFPIYAEKGQAGLQILDRSGRSLYEFRSPERAYREYSDIPPVIVETLLFTENRTMLDPLHPRRNPAIEWGRLSRAIFDYGAHGVNPHHRVIGASTLATQLEKMRHSPRGRTASAREKGRQMLSASLRAYEDGPTTLRAQQRIVRDYLNSLPLAAAPGHGEVTGLGEGLETWYDADFDTVNQLLKAPSKDLDMLFRQTQAQAYRRVLSLLLATRAPFQYLVLQPDALAEETNRYLRVLCRAGVISPELRDLALREELLLRAGHHNATPNFVDNKARDLIRGKLLSMLDLQGTYALDRLDLFVSTTIDAAAQQNITQHLRKLTDPTQIAKLRQHRLLAQSDPRSVIYSFTLYERGPGLNLLRVQADNYDQPLNINEGTKLELGSTAKLRTLINYLQIIEQLHGQYAHASAQDLAALVRARKDPLSAWAAEYLLAAHDKSLQPMLEAALDRRYSASPAEGFFTAGGLHHFRNFEPSDNSRIVTVREAFERSVNLAFIRLMRDIERYYLSRLLRERTDVLLATDDPTRRQYLARFADREGGVFLSGFYRKYAGLSPDGALEKLARSIHLSPLRLAVIYRSVRPDGTLEEFTDSLRRYVPSPLPQERALTALYSKNAPGRFNLADRGYLARVHPLELWLVSYLQQHPRATLGEVMSASADERQQSYSWLFRTPNMEAQNLRIRILLEEDAFKEIARGWRRVGYPFERLVPSFATAIGVSGDTPAALAELMGIVVNNGIRYPSIAVQQLRFAESTPMETVLGRQPTVGERVLSPEIATLVRRELVQVVENGTARRAHGGLVASDGTVIPLGGKTGTGDNRVKVVGRGGRLVESRAANRTAAFVFMIGDRFFGTVMVFVPGKTAGEYEFTSSLAVQVFKDLQPALKPLTERGI
jgi:membrane peptidoglycan carboxypeptidase